MSNQLQNERSPYLLQHAQNPVDWRPWWPAALEEAVRKDRPIFLSVGYSTCHWCHVMARESFESDEVAAALNGDFIPIKVDREERPDVDAVYMEACIAMHGSGGWPLTVLMTPAQEPFWAGTYLPRTQLLDLLEQAARRWKTDRDTLVGFGNALTAHLRRPEDMQPRSPVQALVHDGAAGYIRSFDSRWGGFGRAPKFPAAHNLLFLLRYARAVGSKPARDAALQTLEHIYRGGIFDHVGGGFCRYSTDRQWLVPHFEKMLYDNALLALAYTEAWQETGQAFHRRAACRTLDYVLEELTDPEGGFYCGQDADSDGVEGKYYLFTPAEVASVLGSEAADRFCRRFGISEAGHFEGKSIPNRIGAQDWAEEGPETADMCRRLQAYRRQRTRLHRDDKVLAGWNGLMMAALARAGLVLNEPRYLEAGLRAADFIRTKMTEGGRLLACWRKGQAAQDGKLEDYAFCAWGLLGLYGAVFQIDLLESACAVAGRMLELFFDEDQGGFYPYAFDAEQLITRKKSSYGGAMPSGNAAAALVLSRLARLTGETRWQTAADRQMAWLAGAAAEHPAGDGLGLLALLEELWPSAELVCTASRPPEALLRFLRQTPRDGLTVLLKTPVNAARLASAAPFTAGYPILAAGSRYYLCRGKTCADPVETIEDLEKLF